jgi:PTS system nitrogen regulatory IIA component
LGITDLLAPADVMLNLRVSDKRGALQELCQHMAAKLNLDLDEVLGAALRREELGSTGMGEGVALSHARLDGVQRPTGSLARLAHPIPFDAIDGSPVDIIVLLLLPTGPQGTQLNALARIARTLRDPALRERLRQAQTRDALYAALASQAA